MADKWYAAKKNNYYCAGFMLKMVGELTAGEYDVFFMRVVEKDRERERSERRTRKE